MTIHAPAGPRVISKSRAAAGRKTANSATSSSPAPSGAAVGDRHALEQLAAQLGQPGPVALDVTSTGNATRSRHSAAAAEATSGGTRSDFDSASSRGSDASRGSCSASSRSITSKFDTGSDPSSGARSSTCTSSRVRSTCARKSCPSPAPSEAPSISPGMSAMTSWRSSASIVPSTGSQRRERVGGDLRLRAGHPRQQRGLAGVGQADEADVGEQLEVQLDLALLARQPLLGQPRRLADRGREALVAAPARAAARQRDLLAGPHEVVRAPVPALDLRAGRDEHDQRDRRRRRASARPGRGRRDRRV